MADMPEELLFYDRAYDERRRKWNDTGDPDLHLSLEYPDGIPAKIWEKMKVVIDSGRTF